MPGNPPVRFDEGRVVARKVSPSLTYRETKFVSALESVWAEKNISRKGARIAKNKIGKCTYRSRNVRHRIEPPSDLRQHAGDKRILFQRPRKPDAPVCRNGCSNRTRLQSPNLNKPLLRNSTCTPKACPGDILNLRGSLKTY
jgi:hypothetical protein